MLRARLFLNLVPFAVVVLGVGAYAVILFSHLAREVDHSVVDNQRCAMAAQTMKAALSGLSDSLRQALRGELASATNLFQQHSLVFERELNLQFSNAHLFAATTLPQQLLAAYEGFRDGAHALLRSSQRREQRQIFEQNLVPRELALSVTLDQMVRVAQENILATSQRIQEINQRITRLMLAAVAVALLVSALVSIQTSRLILQPIQSLTRATRAIGQGRLDQVIPADARGELGELAGAFNKMAAQLRAFRESTTEQIVRLHHTMEAALAAFPDPVYVLDRQGCIELKNRAARELGAQSGLEDTLPGRLAEAATEVLRRGADFLPHSFKEVLSLRVGGGEKSFLPRILTMRDDKSEPVGVAVVLHDVTRFRLLDDAKTNLVATVSHELKSPLTSVRMVLYMLLERTFGPLSREQTELLETARRDAERLLRILNDLLDLTRLEAGHSGLNCERITPADLVQAIEHEAEQNVLENDLILTCYVQPDLPSVAVDRQRISHVFQNLVANAIRHSPPAGEIQVRAFQVDGGVQFSVVDQGPGVPEEYQTRIFDRFFRVPGQPRAGAGLGLSIAREITVAHGGRIGVRSEPEQGSEFFIVLPCGEEDRRVVVRESQFQGAGDRDNAV
jgi:signal transduction histidine kinase